MDLTLIIKILFVVIGAVFTFLGGNVAKEVAKYLVSNHLDKLALQAVHMAEDYYKKFKGETKFRHAVEFVAKRLKKLHINIDEDDIESAVSSAYNKAKHSIEDEIEDQKDDE